MKKMVDIFKALSEEIRIRMLMLLTTGELCVCDLMEAFGEPQSKVSRHLSYLKRSGLVKSRRVGAWMHYSLRDDLDSAALEQIALIRKTLSTDASFRRDLERVETIKKAKLCENKSGSRAKKTI